MLLDGVSIRGSYHEVNQDSYGFHLLDKGFIVALSDGLGSKKQSQFGSHALCESAIEIAEDMKDKLIDISPDEFVEKVHEKWKEKLSRYDLTECYATMLIFIIYAGRAFAIRLGDGFIGLWADGQVKVLFDRKEDHFANETDCLTENLLSDKLEIYELDVSELCGGVLCSDGVGIGNMLEKELTGFTKEFIKGYGDMKREDISADIQSWLKDWPGADDKTLAYFISERN